MSAVITTATILVGFLTQEVFAFSLTPFVLTSLTVRLFLGILLTTVAATALALRTENRMAFVTDSTEHIFARTLLVALICGIASATLITLSVHLIEYFKEKVGGLPSYATAWLLLYLVIVVIYSSLVLMAGRLSRKRINRH
jgi:hypothetical protein